MQYAGQELKEIAEPQLVNPPREMLVWNSEGGSVYRLTVHAIVGGKNCDYPVITTFDRFRHCAEISKPKLATYRQLAKWLAEGNGEMRRDELDVFTDVSYNFSMANDSVDDSIFVRKWSDTEWHKPTREYLGLESQQ